MKAHALALAFFVAIAIAPVHASTLDVVRQRLTQLSGNGAVSGNIEVASESSSEKKHESRSAAAEFDCSSAALRLSVSTRDLAQAVGGTTVQHSLIEMTDVWSRLNSAPLLLKKLRRATVVNEQASAWAGQRATRLELKIERDDNEEMPKMVKMKMDETNALWVSADGTPLALENQGKATVRFLVVSMKATGRSVVQYAVTGDRLVIVREVEESNSSGMGESGQEKKTTTLTLKK